MKTFKLVFEIIVCLALLLGFALGADWLNESAKSAPMLHVDLSSMQAAYSWLNVGHRPALFCGLMAFILLYLLISAAYRELAYMTHVEKLRQANARHKVTPINMGRKDLDAAYTRWERIRNARANAY